MAPFVSLLIAFALSTTILASPHGYRHVYPHRALAQRAPPPPALNKRCIPRPANATTPTATPSATPYPTAPQNVAGAPSSPPAAATPSSSTPSSSPPPAQTTPSSSGSASGSGFLAGLQYGFGTWYNTGLGSCGDTNADTDLIVAVAESLYDGYPGYSGANPNTNPVCGRKVKIFFGTASVTATVVDRCTGCRNETSLDLSPGAFSQLASQSLGIIPIMWQWA